MPRGDATWHTESRWLAARNGTTAPNERIPGYGAVRVVSVDNTTGLVTVAKPDADNQKVYLVGPADIAQAGDGLLTRDWPAWVLYESADGTPAPGQEWGVASGGYKLRSGKTGYRIVGGAAEGRVLVEAVDAGGGPGTEPVEVTSTRDGVYYVGYKLIEFSSNPPRFRRGDQIRILNLADAAIT